MTPKQPIIFEPLAGNFTTVLEKISGNRPLINGNKIDAKPFVKWVGGKRSIINDLTKRMPENYDRYIEPFIGGGALYFETQPENAFISDINLRLVLTYKAIRDNVDELIELLQTHKKNHSKEYFYEARHELAEATYSVEIAAWFIYLNKTCYNGMYRVNKKGDFNVPIGSYKNPNILDEYNLKNASKVLKNTTIGQGSFNSYTPKANDFFYLDPPYHKTYDQYSTTGFGDSEHEKLAEYCKQIDKAGGYFMLSNSDTDFVRELYKDYTKHIKPVSAKRLVSCKAHQRGKETELLITNY